MPPDFYNEDIIFEEPEELMNIFSYHEEQNLKKIRESQEIEDQLEMEKEREAKVKKEIGNEIIEQEKI